MRLGGAGEFGLPVAVADDIVDVAFGGRGRVEVLARHESDMAGRTLRIIGVEHGADALLVANGAGDRVVDALTGLVCDFADLQHPVAGSALALKIAFINPAPDDALDLVEEMQLRLAVRIAEIGIEKVLREFVGDRAGALVLHLRDREGDAFADDSFKKRLPRPHHVGSKS